MKIIINGKEENLSRPMTIRELVEAKGWIPEKIVVERNLEIVAREIWTHTVLKEQDRVEILRFVGGGEK